MMVTAFSRRKSTQNLWDPSFFRTNTTGAAHGPSHGSITPFSSICATSSATIGRRWGAILRGGCFTGAASPVLIRCCTKLVRPISPAPLEKVSAYFSRASCNLFLSDTSALPTSSSTIWCAAWVTTLRHLSSPGTGSGSSSATSATPSSLAIVVFSYNVTASGPGFRMRMGTYPSSGVTRDLHTRTP